MDFTGKHKFSKSAGDLQIRSSPGVRENFRAVRQDISPVGILASAYGSATNGLKMKYPGPFVAPRDSFFSLPSQAYRPDWRTCACSRPYVACDFSSVIGRQ